MKKMKNLFAFFFTISLAMLIFTGCDKEEEFDWDNYKVVIQNLTGQEIPMQGRYYTYEVPIRGESVFTWSADNATIIDNLVELNNVAVIGYPDAISPGDPVEVITIIETAANGVDSYPYNFELDSITPFAALLINGVASGDTILAGPDVDLVYAVSPNALDQEHSSYAWTVTGGTLSAGTEDWETGLRYTIDDTGNYFTLTLTETSDLGPVAASTLVLEVKSCPLDDGINDFIGTWVGDDTDNESQVTMEVVDDTVRMTGLGFGWMTGYWGEVITDGGTVPLLVNLDGTLEIEEQYYMSTTYNGDVQDPYTIVGTGTWNNCGENLSIVINYELSNYGYDWGDYLGVPFVAELEIDPDAGKIVSVKNTPVKMDRSYKPILH